MTESDRIECGCDSFTNHLAACPVSVIRKLEDRIARLEANQAKPHWHYVRGTGQMTNNNKQAPTY